MLKFNGSKKAKEKAKSLEEENKELRTKVTTLEDLLAKSKSKRVEKLKKLMDKIPSGARGTGSLMVYKDEEYQTVEFETKADLQDLVDQAERGELEIVLI